MCINMQKTIVKCYYLKIIEWSLEEHTRVVASGEGQRGWEPARWHGKKLAFPWLLVFEFYTVFMN